MLGPVSSLFFKPFKSLVVITSMSEITDLLADGTTLFTAITTLAVVITGFLVGRRWFRKL